MIYNPVHFSHCSIVTSLASTRAEEWNEGPLLGGAPMEHSAALKRDILCPGPHAWHSRSLGDYHSRLARGWSHQCHQSKTLCDLQGGSCTVTLELMGFYISRCDRDCWITIFMDFMIELIHEVKCSLKYIIYYYIVLIESLATNLHSFKLLFSLNLQKLIPWILMFLFNITEVVPY